MSFVDIHAGIEQIKALKTELAQATRAVRDQARALAREEPDRGVESTATTFRSSRTHFEDLISQFVLGPDGDV
jgi:hypothetical protein